MWGIMCSVYRFYDTPRHRGLHQKLKTRMPNQKITWTACAYPVGFTKQLQSVQNGPMVERGAEANNLKHFHRLDTPLHTHWDTGKLLIKHS